MQYVISWWDGDTKQHTVCKDREIAEEKRAAIKARSVANVQRSFEPVRVMPLNVFKKMNELVRISSSAWTKRCKHGPFRRLCITCVGESING